MRKCGQPGYVFRDFGLKQGIEFAIFCFNQGICLSIFVLNRISPQISEQLVFQNRPGRKIWSLACHDIRTKEEGIIYFICVFNAFWLFNASNEC